jgi:hypothetical protein
MPVITEYEALIPALNERCSTFRGPSWWLADSLQFRGLSAQEVRLIAENSPRGFTHRAEENQRVLVVSNLTSGPLDRVKDQHEEYLRAVALTAQTCLNIASGGGAVSFPYCAVISTARTRRLRSIYEFESWGDTLHIRNARYQVKPEISQDELQELYSITFLAYQAQPALHVTMSRYCSALVKSNDQDKLIDLTIALESIVPGGGEFRFRFPFFLSLIISPNTTERIAANDLLTEVYDARSALVHGSIEYQGKIDRAIQHWQSIEDFARRCLFYRIHFETHDHVGTWKDHLLSLAYGAAPLL